MEDGAMDIDMDIDLGPIDDNISQAIDDSVTLNSQDQLIQIDRTASTVSEKVHIRGLDDLTENDIKTFSAEHYPHHPPIRVEWVDDNSANLVFDSSNTARSALESFTLTSHRPEVFSLSPLQLRDAKTLSTHPQLRLQIRTALSTDQKRPRAYEASRFYMMHPEHDPREQRRRKGRRPPHGSGEYRSRRYSEEEQQRRRHRDHEDGFDPSMYDDKGISSRHISMDSLSDEHIHNGTHHSRHRKDLYRPVRDRSASPIETRIANGRIRRTSPQTYRPHPFPSQNQRKELFPLKSNDQGLAKQGKDLFSNKLLASGLKKELFPQKAIGNHHRRSDAFDAADETADLFANGLSVPFAGPEPRSSTKVKHDGGINILGASNQQDTGFTIRGGASAAGTIKELFPGKALGNEGKELFAGKLRGGRRNRAEDMFH